MKKIILLMALLFTTSLPLVLGQEVNFSPEKKVETDSSFQITGKVEKVNENTFIVSGELIAVNTDENVSLLTKGKIKGDDLVVVNGEIKNKIKIAQKIKILKE